VIAQIIAQVIEWLLKQVFIIIGRDLDQWNQDRKINAQAQKDAEEVKDAKSAEDRQKAADDLARHIGNL
jgi:hypothetical protein